jgi:hypothetical protein
MVTGDRSVEVYRAMEKFLGGESPPPYDIERALLVLAGKLRADLPAYGQMDFSPNTLAALQLPLSLAKAGVGVSFRRLESGSIEAEIEDVLQNAGRLVGNVLRNLVRTARSLNALREPYAPYDRRLQSRDPVEQAIDDLIESSGEIRRSEAPVPIAVMKVGGIIALESLVATGAQTVTIYGENEETESAGAVPV